jgi:hypothetical protein
MLPTLLTVFEFQYKQLAQMIVAVVILVVLCVKGAAISDAVFSFLGNAKHDWIFLILAAVLGGVYFYDKTIFAGLTVAFLVSFFVLLSFQYGQVQAGNKDQTSKNRFFLFLIFVLPVLPLAKWMSTLDNARFSTFLLVFYFIWTVSFLLGNPNNVMSQKDYQTGVPYLLGITGFFLLMLIYIHANIIQTPWENFYSRSGIFVGAAIVAILVVSQMTTFMMGNEAKSNTTLLTFTLLIFGGLFLYALTKRQYFSQVNLAIKALYVLFCLYGFQLGVVAVLVGVAVGIYYAVIKTETVNKGTIRSYDVYRLNKVQIYNPNTHFGYNYAISAWIYLKSQPPNETANASTFVNIMDYGGKPAVVYNAAINTLRISMKDEQGDNILVTDIPDVPLQKWNYFVFYYNNESLDVFCNAKLITSFSIVPKLEDQVVTIGDSGGNRGKLANLEFEQGSDDPTTPQKDAATLTKIQRVYKRHQHQDPPTA